MCSSDLLTLTFALTGLGEARIDDVAVRVVERGGTPASLVSTTPEGAPGGFARPSDLLGPGTVPQQKLPPARPQAATPPARPPDTAGPAWPGMNIEWPNLNPFTSPNAPPPGVGGGTIDPFKRARGQ